MHLFNAPLSLNGRVRHLVNNGVSVDGSHMDLILPSAMYKFIQNWWYSSLSQRYLLVHGHQYCIVLSSWNPEMGLVFAYLHHKRNSRTGRVHNNFGTFNKLQIFLLI